MRKEATREIKVLSIRQPHADRIISSEKWAENRTWRTKYRGVLYIHASRWDGPPVPTAGNGVIGAIIGKVRLVEVVDLDEVEIEEEEALLRKVAKRYGLPARQKHLDAALGPVCFILADPKPLKTPIPALGKLNIWTFHLPE